MGGEVTPGGAWKIWMTRWDYGFEIIYWKIAL